ncbi:ATP-dependent nuclease [Polluticaenibacter yanchengensis]|uniref:AAA family ATPase n=1 Tax=Polluticaenibacter yanchengensis TaxID=3014562 RepID=A0ABT4UFB5_9BACT|nr:AAA family ATPase [Chitinophagaceae bacterium LY-5]
MQIAKVQIENFRGILTGELLLSEHNVLVGDNNTGKSTILEAIDLVLGPERLSRQSIIDEHDFYGGDYLDMDKNPIEIKIEIVIINLNEEQHRHFLEHLEWWDTNTKQCLDSPPAESTDKPSVVPALRVGFKGSYDKDDDDFKTKTYFLSPISIENGELVNFRSSDKRVCGFLFLRTLRTGSRALSLERGSLLDIILKLKDTRLQIWEDVLSNLRKVPVAEKPELGVTDILSAVQKSLHSFVNSNWSDNPHLKVSDLTRESLRRILTVFMDTGAISKNGSRHTAPFQHQGTGTINILVLSLLSIIAELKQNVIFAMEEPEIAIPPHTQKSIIESIRNKSAQALFTSHSPYVLEEFEPSQILVLHRKAGKILGCSATYPPTVKPKAYRSEFRKRFCEALLANHVLITEGRTEYDAFPAVARRLHELYPEEFSTLDALGIAIIDAESDTKIAALGSHFISLNKNVLAVYDLQEPEQMTLIKSTIPNCFEAPEKGFEKVIVNGIADAALRRFGLSLVSDGLWPTHLSNQSPYITMPEQALRETILKYLTWSKGAGSAADLLGQCSKDEMPKFIVETISKIHILISPPKTVENPTV